MGSWKVNRFNAAEVLANDRLPQLNFVPLRVHDPTKSCRVVELSGLQRAGDLVSTEDDAGRHCFRADELE